MHKGMYQMMLLLSALLCPRPLMLDLEPFLDFMHLLQIEKRMARREATRAREDSPEMLRVVGGGSIMGGDDSFEAAKAR